MFITTFWVEGYRSFSERVQLSELGQVVAFFGVNNVGKSNLLRVIALLGSVMQLPLIDISRRRGFPWDELKRISGEDASLFSLGKRRMYVGANFQTRKIVPGSASVADEVTISFVLEHQDDAVAISLDAWSVNGQTQLEPMLRWNEAISKQVGIDEAHRHEVQRLMAAWEKLGQHFQVESAAVAILPLSSERRKRLVSLGQSRDAKARTRYRQILDLFQTMDQGLPPGRLAPLENPPEYPQDLCWETDDGLIPLNQLGTGSQAILGMIASMLLAEAQLVLLEEPESHLNALLQEKVAPMLQEVAKRFELQVIMATHATTFAQAGVDIRHLERGVDGVARVQQLPEASALQPYQPVLPGSEVRHTTLPLVDHNKRVRVPDFVLEHLGVTPGQWLHFERDGERVCLLNSAQHDALVGEKA